MAASGDITFVLTSCGRFDLLAETVVTFLEHNTAPIARWLIVEDSGAEAVRDVLGGIDAPLEFLVNDPPVGQIRSIDRAYALVDTPYVFHCEDDWRFFRRGFVEESRVVLDGRADVSTVVARRPSQNAGHDAALADAPVEHVAHVPFRRSTVGAESPWGGYTFNPGLRRTRDIRALGSFAALGHEGEASAWFKARGMRLAALEQPACETTGQLRHVRNERTPSSSRGRLWRP